MEKLVLFLFFLQFDELFLQHFLQVSDQLFVVILNLGNFDLRALKDVIFYLVSVALHRQAKPLFHADLQSASLVVFVAPLLHFPYVLVFVSVLLPGLEKGLFVILRVEESCKIFNLVPFLLDLSELTFTFRLRIQYASNYFLL
jgi:hypothetical protein